MSNMYFKKRKRAQAVDDVKKEDTYSLKVQVQTSKATMVIIVPRSLERWELNYLKIQLKPGMMTHAFISST